jgi:hypothetical protein
MADWTIERVRALSTVDIRALHGNAVRLNNEEITSMCTEALAETGKTLRAREAGTTPFDGSAVEVVAAALEATVPETEEQLSGSLRSAISEIAARAAISSRLTLADLWYHYVVCAFSAQEKSGKGTAAHLFETTKNPLHTLQDVASAGADESWIATQLEQFAEQCKQAKVSQFGFVKAKTKVLLRSYPLFAQVGAPDDALAVCCRGQEDLRVFCDLARGTVSDRNLATSARLSKTLEPKSFHGVSHKQVRSILINSGLCSNVLPLDSRWKRFLEEKAQIRVEGDFARKDYYLAVEDLLRQALISIRAKNPEFPVEDLATLDAVVFEYFD